MANWLNSIGAEGNLTTGWGSQVSSGPAPFTNSKSIILSGGTDYFSAGNAASLTFERTNTFSFSLWAKFNGNGPIFSKNVNGSSPGYDMFYLNGHIYWELIGQTGDLSDINTSGTFATGTWFHVTLTYDGSGGPAGQKIYVNGSAAATVVNGSNLASSIISTTPFQISGRNNGLSVPVTVDEFAVWNANLSASNVTSIYNSGHPGDISQLSFYSSECVTWWRMGDGSSDTFSSIADQKGTNTLTGFNTSSSNLTTDVP